MLEDSIFVPEASSEFQDAGNGRKHIIGYWENWNAPANPGPGGNTDASYYTHDFQPLTHVFYAFLLLLNYNNRPEDHWGG